jgi:DNA-binding response OmpR family regulator
MSAHSKPREQPAARPRILIVEDESVIAMLLEDMITDCGYEVVGPVARLDKAVEVAQREALDVAILDVNLNGEEVYPVAAALAAREIPFLFSTGYGKGGVHAPYHDRPTLQKPFQLHDVRAALAAIRGAKAAADGGSGNRG